MAETSTFLAGNLTSDPGLRYATSSTARATFRVAVAGRLQQRSWQAEGTSRSAVEVVAGELGPSLRWATTTRATRSPGS